MVDDWRIYIREHPRFGTYYRVVEGPPSWVVRVAAGCALVVVVLPLLVLLALAVAVGVVVFAVLATAVRVAGFFSGGSGGSGGPGAGRRNVRVVRSR